METTETKLQEIAPEKNTAPVDVKLEPKVKKTKAPAKLVASDSDGIARNFLVDQKGYSKLVLAKDENDPDWDAKMLLDVPESLIAGMAEHGWDESMPLRVRDLGDGTFKVTQGRTKMRALPEANKLRAKHKLPPIVVPVIAIDGEDEIASMRVAVRLNEHQNRTDPMTKARTIERFFAAGLTEADAAADLGMTTKKVLEHYELLKLPKKVQKLIQDGKMTVTAALGLVHVDEKKVEALADRLVSESETVGKVTQAAAKAAVSGNDAAPDRLNAKQTKALIDEIEGTEFGGKHGKAIAAAAKAVLEAVLDARKRTKVIAKLGDIAK